MNIQEAYINFLTIVNRNLTNNNLDVDKSRFIILFNSTQVKYLEWILNKRNEDQIRYASTLLEDSNLKVKEKSDNKNMYSLPEDYFDFSNLRVKASNKTCNSIDLHTFEVKTEDLQELLNDSFNEPSIKFRETFYHLSGKESISVYKKDFKIDDVTLSYYRYPDEVDIKGYYHINGSQSSDKDPVWDSKATYRILTAMAKQYAANINDPNKYQTSNNQLFSTI